LRTQSSIILTGSPVSETWFQSVISMERLLAGIRTVLRLDTTPEDEIFFFSDHRGVTSLHELPPVTPFTGTSKWGSRHHQAAVSRTFRPGVVDNRHVIKRRKTTSLLRKASGAAYVVSCPHGTGRKCRKLVGTRISRSNQTLWDLFHEDGPVAMAATSKDYIPPTQKDNNLPRINIAYDSDTPGEIAEYAHPVPPRREGSSFCLGNTNPTNVLLLEPVEMHAEYISTSWFTKSYHRRPLHWGAC